MDTPLPERSPGRTRSLAAVVLAITFVSGGLAGAGVHHLFRPPPPLGPFDLPVHELDLTAEQRAKIDAVLASHQPQIAETTREVFPKMKQIGDQIRAQIREVLTPKQREIVDRLEAEHGGPPPMPGAPGFRPPDP